MKQMLLSAAAVMCLADVDKVREPYRQRFKRAAFNRFHGVSFHLCDRRAACAPPAYRLVS